MTPGPPDLLRERLVHDPASPLLTFYDDATGERVELSATTFANWVAKTAGLLTDVYAVGAGDTVAIHLPVHWLVPVWWHACWQVGAVPAASGDPLTSALAVASPATLDAVLDAPQVVVCSLLPFAVPVRDPLPAGVDDYSIEVRAMPDAFTQRPAPASAVAVRHHDQVVTQGELVERSSQVPQERVLSHRTIADVEDAVRVAVAPLRPGASLVLTASPWADDDPRIEQERITLIDA